MGGLAGDVRKSPGGLPHDSGILADGGQEFAGRDTEILNRTFQLEQRNTPARCFKPDEQCRDGHLPIDVLIDDKIVTPYNYGGSREVIVTRIIRDQ